MAPTPLPPIEVSFYACQRLLMVFGMLFFVLSLYFHAALERRPGHRWRQWPPMGGEDLEKFERYVRLCGWSMAHGMHMDRRSIILINV